MVTHRGIEASLEQVKAILDLEWPKSKKDIQSLTGRIVALNRFISKSLDKNKVIYDVLKKNKELKWEQEREEAFQKIKEYLEKTLILSKPKEGEPLQLYLAVSEGTISVVLTIEEDKK